MSRAALVELRDRVAAHLVEIEEELKELGLRITIHARGR
jgi:hypothetical protein